MPTNKKKLAYAIALETGRSYQGALDVMAAALRGEAWAMEIVETARHRLGWPSGPPRPVASKKPGGTA
jgi:hypothetical protein